MLMWSPGGRPVFAPPRFGDDERGARQWVVDHLTEYGEIERAREYANFYRSILKGP